ncbi:putative transcriptional regulator, TetR family [Candidatus Protochlamydia naegleriophila]|uniref:Putative transcriptional regulator, TetR family n=1 Tax=Candidatus Protochlamydia naegleriophila TaxID=389348 RepID=A0A0U5J9K0_9BACT|nr:TetR/AcrR family transcriptional regulator [Candidatus Protochlamydia naegleriophila]CUI16110.1 putative transcriptional regulator, TetR family [Candidatus Protochlamydia naegleriophila]
MSSRIDTKRAVAAAKTQEKILKAACHLFVKKGFDGTSISEIAKKAQINQSLIYHYYASKEELWKSVKRQLVGSYVEKGGLEFDAGRGLRDILKHIVHSRFEFYERHPEILRMLSWQKLELTKDKLAGGTPFSPDNWKEPLTQLQKLGQIRKEIDIDMMSLFITSAINGALSEDYLDLLKDPKAKMGYLNMIVECLMRSFSVA